MVMTSSTMLELGTTAPEFDLPDVMSGDRVSLSYFQGRKATLVMFICSHCPFVVHVEKELAKLGHDYVKTELGIVAISSNDVGSHPGDKPEKLREQGERLDFNFPYLYDETQKWPRLIKLLAHRTFFSLMKTSSSSTAVN